MHDRNASPHTRKRDARWLLLEKHEGRECPSYLADLARLKSGEPLAYVIGWVDFLGCRIDLSEHPLIPRPETEWWVERLVNEFRDRGLARKKLRILDMFSGSGCIGVAIARAFPNAKLVATDIDQGALRAIQRNARESGATRRVRALRSDGFKSVRGKYDLILANPPYIDAGRPHLAERSVRRFEPARALFAGEAGLFHIKSLIREAGAFLAPGGLMVIEFGRGQKRAIEDLLKRSAWKYAFEKDQYGVWRTVRLSADTH